MKLLLREADIVLVKAPGLVSRLITWVTGGIYHHVFGITGRTIAEVEANGDPIVSDWPLEAPELVEADAVNGVKAKSIYRYQDGRHDVSIWRHRYLTPADRHKVVRVAVDSLGKPYGYALIAATFVDRWLFGRKFATRRIADGKSFSDCSVLWAVAYSSAGVKFNNATPEGAVPNDIALEVTDSPSWVRVWPIMGDSRTAAPIDDIVFTLKAV